MGAINVSILCKKEHYMSLQELLMSMLDDMAPSFCLLTPVRKTTGPA